MGERPTAVSFLVESIIALTKGAKDEDDGVKQNKKCSDVRDIKYVLVLVKGQDAFREGVVSCHGIGMGVGVSGSSSEVQFFSL